MPSSDPRARGNEGEVEGKQASPVPTITLNGKELCANDEGTSNSPHSLTGHGSSTDEELFVDTTEDPTEDQDSGGEIQGPSTNGVAKEIEVVNISSSTDNGGGVDTSVDLFNDDPAVIVAQEMCPSSGIEAMPKSSNSVVPKLDLLSDIDTEDGSSHGVNEDIVDSQEESNSGTEDVKKTESDSKGDWMDILGNGDLKKKIIKVGAGKSSRPQQGQMVSVNMVGKLASGVLVDQHNGFVFTVGDAEIIQGLDLAITLMEKEETSEIMIASRFAYGTLGREPDVPPNSNIEYKLELIDVMDEPQPENLTMMKRLDIGIKKREKGNFWYSRKDYAQALQCYRKSLDFLDDENQDYSEAPSSFKKLLDERLKVYNNMAATQLKMEAYDSAIKSVDTVLRVQPHNVKALYRKGKILGAQGETEDAIYHLKKATQLEPDSKLIYQELLKLKEKRKTESQSEKDLYRRMLGQSSSGPDPQQQPTGSSFRSWGLVFGGVAAIALGMLAYRHMHGGW